MLRVPLKQAAALGSKASQPCAAWMDQTKQGPLIQGPCLSRLLSCLLPVFLLFGFAGALLAAIRSSDALALALADPVIQQRVQSLPAFETKVRFLDRWECWMVEWFHEEERVAFVTLSPEGSILERGPQGLLAKKETLHPGQDKAGRQGALHLALEQARADGNEAEVDEILALLRELEEREHRDHLDPVQWLASVRLTGSHGMNVLRWPVFETDELESDALPFRAFIQRQQDGRWQPEALLPFQHGIWRDTGLISGQTQAYRLRCVDSMGEELGQRLLHATPTDLKDSPLEAYHLKIAEADWARMLDEVTKDIEVSGTFEWQNGSWPMQIRLRGASTRHALKKSFRVSFPDSSPLPSRVIYFKAEPMDHTMQQEKLSHDLFHAEGHPCSQVTYVNLSLNGVYQGVYLQVEPIRTPFKEQAGLNPQGHLIRAATFGDPRDAKPGDPRGKQERIALDALKRFLIQAWDEPDDSFESWVRQHMDWPRVRDYLALQTLCHRSEIEANDYFFYQDPDSGQWSFLPWDHNNGNFAVAGFGNRLHEPHIDVFPQSIPSAGWQVPYTYILHSRIFRDPVLSRAYLKRLEELVHSWILTGRIDGLIDQNMARLRLDYPVDPYRTPWRGEASEDPFLKSGAALKQWARKHGQRLLDQIYEIKRSRSAPKLTFLQWEVGGFRLRWPAARGWHPLEDGLQIGLRQGEAIQQKTLASYEPVLEEGFWEVLIPSRVPVRAVAALLLPRKATDGSEETQQDEDRSAAQAQLMLDWCLVPLP